MKIVMCFLAGFKKGFSSFGYNISIIINSILLSIVYFIGVGLTSILAKLAGKHFLDVKKSLKRDSYWSNLNLRKKGIKGYYRQF